MTATFLGSFTGGTTLTVSLASYKDYKKIKKTQIFFTNIQAYGWGKCTYNYEDNLTTDLLNIQYSNLDGILSISGGYAYRAISYTDAEGGGNKTTVATRLYADVYLIQP